MVDKGVDKNLNNEIKEFLHSNDNSSSGNGEGVGRVIQVMGPVVDIEFPGNLPAINNLLRANDKENGLHGVGEHVEERVDPADIQEDQKPGRQNYRTEYQGRGIEERAPFDPVDGRQENEGD